MHQNAAVLTNCALPRNISLVRLHEGNFNLVQPHHTFPGCNVALDFNKLNYYLPIEAKTLNKFSLLQIQQQKVILIIRNNVKNRGFFKNMMSKN